MPLFHLAGHLLFHQAALLFWLQKMRRWQTAKKEPALIENEGLIDNLFLGNNYWRIQIY